MLRRFEYGQEPLLAGLRNLRSTDRYQASLSWPMGAVDLQA